MKKIEIEITNTLRISGQLPERVLHKLRERLIFQNPAYEQAEKFGRSVYGIPEKLSFIHTANGAIILPRGFISQLKTILDYNRVEYGIKNRLRRLPSVDFLFRGKLYPYQERAVSEMLKKNFGTLSCPTGGGKTIMALKLIAERKQPALIVCHSKELMFQWRDRITQFLGIPLGEVGLVGDGNRFDETKLIHVGIVNSLRKCADTVKNFIGHLIVDETHRVPGSTFSEVVSKFDSAFMLGLSATCFRRDGLTKLIFFFIGDRRHTIDTGELQTKRFILRPELRVRETFFEYDYQDDYPAMLSALIEDKERNELIVNEVVRHSRNCQGVSLVISDRKKHCFELFQALQDQGLEVRLLIGSSPSDERREIVKEIAAGGIDAVVATSSLISEGFDSSRLASLHLAVPVAFSGRLLQVVGRIVRTSDGKRTATIFDYFDCRVGVLSASFNKRCRVYRGLGISCNVQTAFAAA
ncbi:MAG: DEAD/DEAH box helicase [Candidatus Scalindua sp.]|nr:DEAD/DEAH box helicase [Candidatus Scalindua sp.]